MDSLLGEFAPATLPSSLPTNPIDIEPKRTEDLDDDLDDLITMLSSGHRSSPQSARSSNQLGQDSVDSHVAELLAELKNTFNQSFEDLISDQTLQERMMAISTELEPLSQQLPIASRALPSTVKDFLKNLALKLPIIRRVIPAYEKEVEEKSKILKQLTDAKEENAKLKENLIKGKGKEAEIDQEIGDLEKRLEDARRRKQRLNDALQQGIIRQQNIAANSKQWAVNAKAVVAKLNSLEAEYQTARSDSQLLKEAWEGLQKT